MNFLASFIINHPFAYLLIVFILIIWTIPWKIVALWKAARNSQKVWFVILFFLNTLAILDIIYIYVIQKSKNKKKRK